MRPARRPQWPAGRRSPRARAERRAEARGDVRVVDHRLRFISPWSVFKVAGLFYICVLLMFMVAGVMLWRIGRTTETVDQVEDLVTRLGAYGECVPETEVEPGTDFETDDDCPEGQVIVDGFRFNDGTLFRSALFSGIIFVVAGTLCTVLFTVLVNLLNDVTGGVRYTIVREGTGPPSRSPDPANQR